MTEYIEREVLKERITAEKDAHDTDTPYLVAYNNGLTMAYAMVVAMPAADVEVVKRGRWFEMVDSKLDTHTGECWEEVYYNCLECDYASDWKSPYCPNCGAKMDLEVQ